jgi:hypothetical protein
MSEPTAAGNECPTMKSVAITVFVAHLALSLLLWFSADHGELSGTTADVLVAMLFPLYIVFACLPDLPDALSLCLLIVMWLVSALLWTGIVVGLLWAFRRARGKLI